MNIEDLIKTHSGMIYNLAFNLTGNRQDAEDVVQETFFKMYSKLDTFKGESKISTWIYRIAMNESLKIIHKLKIDKSHFVWVDNQIDNLSGNIPAEVKELYDNPEKAYLLKALLAEIKDGCHHFMLFHITEEQRIAFIFRTILGFSYKEISEVLQLDESAVKSRLNRAKKNLQKHVKERCQWYNEKSTCSCEKCIGFAMDYTPEIINRIKEYVDRPEYLQSAADRINDIKDIEQVFQKLPLLQYKILPLEKYLKIS